MHSIDGQPMDKALIAAAKTGWSGVLRGRIGQQEVGMVVFCHGRVAWSLSRGQARDLPFYLQTMGKVSPHRLQEILEIQKAPDKSKKLGPILEEAGVIDQALFAECLRAHIRDALTPLVNNPLTVGHAEEGEVAADARQTFSLREALEADLDFPEPGLSEGISTAKDPAPAENVSPFEELALLPGFRYAFIADSAGKLYLYHGVETDVSPKKDLSAWIAEWLRSSLQIAHHVGIDQPRSTFIEGSGQSLLVQVTDPGGGNFLGVAFAEAGKLGVYRSRIASVLPAIQTLTETR